MIEGKNILITGANSGIGKVTAIELAKKGANIIMVCRNKEKAQIAQQEINTSSKLNNTDLLIADLSSSESIRRFADEFYKKYDKLDDLINNAGAIYTNRQENKEGIELTMATNHLGYFLMTHYLLDALKNTDTARIVNVASVAHRFTNYKPNDLNAQKSYQYMKQYGLSKLSNMLFSKYLSQYLKDTNITTNALHPGNIASNFGKNNNSFFGYLVKIGAFALINPNKGALTSIYLASSPEVEGKTGLYWYKQKEEKPSSDAINPEYAQHLWNWSLDKTKIQTFGKI